MVWTDKVKRDFNDKPVSLEELSKYKVAGYRRSKHVLTCCSRYSYDTLADICAGQPLGFIAEGDIHGFWQASANRARTHHFLALLPFMDWVLRQKWILGSMALAPLTKNAAGGLLHRVLLFYVHTAWFNMRVLTSWVSWKSAYRKKSRRVH